MKTMKSLLTTLLLMISACTWADNYQYLTVSQTDGDTRIEVSQIRKLTFDATDMIVTLEQGNEQRIPLASVQKLFFADGQASTIQTTDASQSTFKRKDGVVSVSVAKGESMSLYNMKGEVVFHAEQDVTFSISNLAKGAYILKTGKRCKTIMNR